MSFQGNCKFHEDEINLGFCLLRECQYFEYCYDCKISGIHKNHKEYCLSYKQIYNKLENLFSILFEQKKVLLQSLNKVSQLLTDSLHLNINQKIEECLALKQIIQNEDYSQIKIKLEQLSQYVFFDFEKQRLNILDIQNKCEKFIAENDQQPKSIDLLTESQISKKNNESQIINDQLIEEQQNQLINLQNQKSQQKEVDVDDEAYLQMAIQMIDEDNHLMNLQKSEDLIKQAMDNFSNQNQAVQLLDQALQFVPNNEEALFLKGEILYNQKQFSQSLICFESVQKINPKNDQVLIFRANILNNQEKKLEAEEAYKLAIQKHPHNTKLYSNRASNLNKLGRYSDAISQCDQALAIDSLNSTAYNNRGYALQSLSRFQEALDNYDQALKIDENPEYLCNKGFLLLDLQKIQEAQECLNKILQSNIQSDSSTLFQIQLLTRQGKHQEALNVCLQGISTFPNQKIFQIKKIQLQQILLNLNHSRSGSN